MADKDKYRIAEIITVFLEYPLNRTAFNRFFGLCYQETMIYLRFLKSDGWRLPDDQMQQESAMSDVAYDLLGPFLASRKEKPFYVIFEYFKRQGLCDAEPDMLCRHFRILLRGFIRKELSRLKGLVNPQIRNLKRRIKDILAGPDYCLNMWPGEKDESYFAAKYSDRLRIDSPPISRDRLYSVVKEAFIGSCTRTEWCAKVFEILNENVESRNAIEGYELINTMVAVNAEYVEASDMGVRSIPMPTDNYADRQMSILIDETVNWVEAEVLDRFRIKGKIATADITLILKAVRYYLEDFCIDGNTMEIPKYFHGLKPGLSQSEYIRQYKYILETAIRQGMTEFRKRLRKELTIHPFGNY